MTLYTIMYGPMHILQDGTVGMMRHTMIAPASFKTKDEAEEAVRKHAEFPYDEDGFEIIETNYTDQPIETVNK